LRINIHLAVLKGRMEGFLAAASAFGSSARRVRQNWSWQHQGAAGHAAGAGKL